VLIAETTRLIEQDKVNAEFAFHSVAEKYAIALAAIEDEYLPNAAPTYATWPRASRTTSAASSTARTSATCPNRASSSATTSRRPPPRSSTRKKFSLRHRRRQPDLAHAIMARSMGIPAVVALNNATEVCRTRLRPARRFNGVIIINPTDQTLFEYGQLVRRQATFARRPDLRDKPAITLDGHSVTLLANIEQPDDVEPCSRARAGRGAVRTEYLYINHESLPSEEEQFKVYQHVASRLKPDPVIIRTLDLGGDKFLAHLSVPQEMNPSSAGARFVSASPSRRFFAHSCAPSSAPAPRATSR